MQLAKMVGLKVPQSHIRHVGDVPYYLVERYDRTKNKDGKILRLHQEDFCQAMGIMPDLKYEREGGPNYRQCQDLLRAASTQPAADQIALLKRIIFNYLIGNADAHGKNFSLLYAGKKPVLAPAYDLLSTSVYPDLSVKMAMKIGSQYDPQNVMLRHWFHLVPSTATAQKNLTKQLYDMSAQCLEKAKKLQTKLRKEKIISPIFEKVIHVIHERKQRIRDLFT